MTSTSRDLTPVVPKKNRSLFFYLIALTSLTALLATMPMSLGIPVLSPFPADPSILPLGASSYLLLWTEPIALWSTILGVPLATALLLRYTGIRSTAIIGILLGLVSYALLQTQLRGIDGALPLNPLSLPHALLLSASIIMLSITTFSGLVHLGAQSTAARRLLSGSALGLILPTLFFVALYVSHLLGWQLDSILYGIFLLPLAVWLLKGMITLNQIDLSLDSRDETRPSCSGKASCIACKIVGLISPLMLYSLQIFFVLNLTKLITTQLYSINSVASVYLVIAATLGALLVLRIIGMVILNKRRKLGVIPALLTGSLIPVKLADFFPLRSYPILLPSLFVGFSLVLWYVMMYFAKSINYFYLI